MMRRRDVIALSMIPVVAALGVLLLIILMVTGHTQPVFHPVQLRTV